MAFDDLYIADGRVVLKAFLEVPHDVSRRAVERELRNGTQRWLNKMESDGYELVSPVHYRTRDSKISTARGFKKRIDMLAWFRKRPVEKVLEVADATAEKLVATGKFRHVD